MRNQKADVGAAMAARQLSMVFDAAKLRGLTPPERTVIIVRLARVLLEAAGIPVREQDDERR
jgi:hypothetical protein